MRNLRIASILISAAILARVPLAALGQSQASPAADEVTANLRIRYNPREGNDFYLVVNEGLNTNRFRYDPARPPASGWAVMVKYSTTFVFD